jgi:hypothetical protein
VIQAILTWIHPDEIVLVLLGALIVRSFRSRDVCSL